MERVVDFPQGIGRLSESAGEVFPIMLLNWFEQNARQLPWKKEADPYKIWVSEIILQQTRVEQGTPFYHRFIQNFPTVFDLAKTDEDLLMQVWQGLGYYSRARNMQETAKTIVRDHQGVFPDSRAELLKMKGIGAYTAAAILSFAFNQPYAVVDGNVIRVLSRILGLDVSFHTPEGKKVFEQKAQELLNKSFPGKYNQAIMDFGATCCTPKKPACQLCFFNQHCAAFQQNRVQLLPLPKKKISRKNRYFIFFVIHDAQGNIAIQKRHQSDIWRSLYELPGTETIDFKEETISKAISGKFRSSEDKDQLKLNLLYEGTQILTHQKIHARFYQIDDHQPFHHTEYQFNFANYKNLCNFAFPKIIEKFFTSLKQSDQK